MIATCRWQTVEHMTPQQSELQRSRRWMIGVYLVLLLLVVPWYWPVADATLAFGFPVWALVTLVAVFATSAYTAWVYLTQSDDSHD